MKKIIFTLMASLAFILNIYAQANTSLSNLTTTSINTNLLPKTTSIYTLGSSTLAWKNIYMNGSLYMGSNRFIYAPSTNTFIGRSAGNTNTTGTNNTAIGYKVLLSNTTGYGNLAIGANALAANVNGTNNICLGPGALSNAKADFYEIAIGDSAMFNENPTVGNAGLNIAIGSRALYSNQTGYSNIALGYNSLYLSTEGIENIAIGEQSLYHNTTGGNNISLGYYNLYYNTSGSENTSAGIYTLLKNSTGEYNVAFGNYALETNESGNYNVAIGNSALSENISGTYNTAIGYGSGVTNTYFTNSTAVGYGAAANASNKVVIGNNNVNVIGGIVGWSVLSDGRFKTNIKEDVPGLAFINKLRPVTYNVDAEKYAKFIGIKDSLINAEKENYAKAKQKTKTGFIAQDVEKTAKAINYDFDGVNAPQNDKDNYSLVYSDFIPSLVKAVQELSKQNELQQKQIDSLLTILGTKNQASSPVANSENQNAHFSAAKLEQNIPNPFSANTTIHYFLPQNSINASINVYNVNGTLLKSIKLNSNGNGSITLNTDEFASGAYTYSLIADGKIIASKQMIAGK